MKKLILLSLLLGGLLPLTGQQLTEQQQAFLDSVQQRYVQARSFWMEVDMLSFNKDGALLGEVSTYESFKQGDHYLVRTPYAIQLRTPDLQLIINHQAKLISLLSVKNPSQPKAIMQIEPPFGAGDWPMGEVTWTASNGIVTLQLVPPDGGAQLILNHFDQEQYLLKGVDYYYPKYLDGMPYHIRIQYPLIKINEGVGDAAIDISDYLEQRGGEWVLKEGWQTYEFIDETKP